jgi:hypothetical protein
MTDRAPLIVVVAGPHSAGKSTMRLRDHAGQPQLPGL